MFVNIEINNLEKVEKKARELLELIDQVRKLAYEINSYDKGVKVEIKLYEESAR